jgi:diguanylate cyclase (GGDEF)-like protein
LKRPEGEGDGRAARSRPEPSHATAGGFAAPDLPVRGWRPPPPTSAREIARTLSPFFISALVPYVLQLTGDPRQPALVLVSLAVTVVAMSIGLSVRERLGSWGETVLALIYMGGGVIPLEYGGIPEMGNALPLLLIPLLWAALFCTLRAMLVVFAGALAAIVVPVAIEGEFNSLDAGWQELAIGITIGTLIALTVFRLVRDLHARGNALQSAADLGLTIAREREPRAAICAAVSQAVDAEVVLLFEPFGTDRLVVTAAVGLEAPDPSDPDHRLAVPMDPEVSGACRAFLTQQRDHVPDAMDNPHLSQELVHSADAVSVAFEPIIDLDTPLAVVAIAWHRRVQRISELTATSLRIITNEAAVSLRRSALLERLDVLARTDPLTSVANRRGWAKALDSAIATAASEGQPLCVAMLDLDGFKPYNDRYGHAAGDELLRNTVRAWQAELPPEAVLARTGGDEFVLALPGFELEEAIEVIERLREASPEASTTSAGLVRWESGEDAAEIMHRVDRALYAAKHAGGDRMIAAGPH